MEGMTYVDTDRIIRWSKDENDKWTIKLIKDEENPESNGTSDLRKETVLKEMEYTEE